MAASYKKLFKILIDREMKSKELAAKAGISPATLAKMKKDGATVSSDVLVKICTALECTMDDIVEIVPSDIKESTIQSLKGAMREGDYGLFITLTRYTKNAQKYLDNTPIIRGIDGDGLVELILKYYDGLSDKYKQLIPLQKVYIPNLKSE